MTVESAPVRIERVRPHLLARRQDRPHPPGDGSVADAQLVDDRVATIDLGASAVTPWLGASLARLRERWTRLGELSSQTTFYLFDPDSWRR